MSVSPDTGIGGAIDDFRDIEVQGVYEQSEEAGTEENAVPHQDEVTRWIEDLVVLRISCHENLVLARARDAEFSGSGCRLFLVNRHRWLSPLLMKPHGPLPAERHLTLHLPRRDHGG